MSLKGSWEPSALKYVMCVNVKCVNSNWDCAKNQYYPHNNCNEILVYFPV